jgi:hypothetical protein
MDAPVVDPPENLASPIGGNSLLFQPVDEGFFGKAFYVLGVRHQGAHIRLNGRLLESQSGFGFHKYLLTDILDDNKYNSFRIIDNRHV